MKDTLSLTSKILGVLLQALEFNPVTTLAQILPNIVKENEQFETEENPVEDEQHVKWKILANAQRMSLEILTNVVMAISEIAYNEFVNFIEKAKVFTKVVETCAILNQQINPIVLNTPAASSNVDLIITSQLRCLHCITNIVLGLEPTRNLLA